MPHAHLGLLLMVTLIGGCGFADFARIRMNEPLTMEDVAFIHPAHTTFAEVIDRLGTPHDLLESETGVIAVYRFLDARYSRINYGVLASAWSPVTPDLITEGLDVGVDQLEVQLDKEWKVRGVEFARQRDRPSGLHLVPFVR
ncbi:MAG: hypothetical protein MRJ68_04290 [Nitrospira sp.]|nr:hypothetical protein [Nitrospira sp.]